MIPVLGTGGPGFNSRLAPIFFMSFFNYVTFSDEKNDIAMKNCISDAFDVFLRNKNCGERALRQYLVHFTLVKEKGSLTDSLAHCPELFIIQDFFNFSQIFRVFSCDL